MRPHWFLPLVLAGCVGAPARPDVDPSVELADAWTARVTDGDVVDVAWWSTFEDPQLAELVLEALAANRDLAAARHNVQVAAAQLGVQRAGRLPTVDLTGSGARRRQNFIGFPIPGGGSVLSSTSTVYSAGFGVAWQPDLWGRIAAGIDAAVAQHGASLADLDGGVDAPARQGDGHFGGALFGLGVLVGMPAR